MSYSHPDPKTIKHILGEHNKDKNGEPFFDACKVTVNKAGTGTGHIHVELTRKDPTGYNEFVATFSLQQLPGCCGVMLSYHTQVSYESKNKGIAQALQRAKEQIAQFYGYSVLICTAVTRGEASPAQPHILKKFGWEMVQEFTNRRTSNGVGIFVKELD